MGELRRGQLVSCEPPQFVVLVGSRVDGASRPRTDPPDVQRQVFGRRRPTQVKLLRTIGRLDGDAQLLAELTLESAPARLAPLRVAPREVPDVGESATGRASVSQEYAVAVDQRSHDDVDAHTADSMARTPDLTGGQVVPAQRSPVVVVTKSGSLPYRQRPAVCSHSYKLCSAPERLTQAIPIRFHRPGGSSARRIRVTPNPNAHHAVTARQVDG